MIKQAFAVMTFFERVGGFGHCGGFWYCQVSEERLCESCRGQSGQ